MEEREFQLQVKEVLDWPKELLESTNMRKWLIKPSGMFKKFYVEYNFNYWRGHEEVII